MKRRRSDSHRKVRRPLSTAKKIERVIKSVPILICICAVAWLGSAGVKKLAKPVLLYYRESGEIAQMERELKQINADNIRIKKQNSYLKTREGAQAEARKLGYVRPGEISIVIQKPPADAKR